MEPHMDSSKVASTRFKGENTHSDHLQRIGLCSRSESRESWVSALDLEVSNQQMECEKLNSKTVTTISCASE